MADIDIRYNNSTIASLSGSGSKILTTQGQYCTDNITVDYNAPEGLTIITDTTSTTATVSMDVNKKYIFTQPMDSLTLTLPATVEANYISIVRFQSLSLSSTDTGTSLNYPASIKWASTNGVIDGRFVPLHGAIYEITIIKGDNNNFIATAVEIRSEDYIGDGLVLWLDGIRNTRAGHSTTTTKWEDLSGYNQDFSGLAAARINDNSIILTNMKMPCNNVMAMANCWTDSIEPCTLEFVLKQNSSATYCTLISGMSQNNGRKVWANISNAQFRCASNSFQASNIYNINSYSIQYPADSLGISLAKQNNESCSLTNGSTWGTSDVALNFGAGQGYATDTNVYAIRMYNRLLTAEEVQHNYELDVERFGIEEE